MCNVLVVDDDPGICGLLERILSDHEVYVANTLAEAYERMQEVKPVLIFLDLCLRGERGEELLEHAPNGCAVVIVTGLPMNNEEEVRLLEQGAVAVLSKPFEERRISAVANSFSKTMKNIKPQPERAGESTQVIRLMGSLSAMTNRLRRAQNELEAHIPSRGHDYDIRDAATG